MKFIFARIKFLCEEFNLDVMRDTLNTLMMMFVIHECMCE